MKKKILIYGINFAPECLGIGKYTSDMAIWLADHGYEVSVVTAPPYYPAWSLQKGYSRWRYTRENFCGMEILRCPIYVPAMPNGIKRILHLLSFAATSFPAILLKALNWRPDLIWVVEPPLFIAPAALVASRLIGSRSWLHIQDFEVDAFFSLKFHEGRIVEKIVRSLETSLLKKFQVVTTISHKMISLAAEKGVDPGRLTIFQNWVNPADIYPMEKQNAFREQLKLDDQTFVLLYSGNFGEKQGLEIIIKAARDLKDRKQIRFILAGDGAVRSRIVSMTDDLENITFLAIQPTEKLNELLNLADVHLLPQRGAVSDLVLPSKLSGILSSGRPVIATAVPGSELDRAVRGHGIAIPPEDVDALKQAILTLEKNKDERLRMGADARRYAVANWGRDQVLGDLNRKISDLIGG